MMTLKLQAVIALEAEHLLMSYPQDSVSVFRNLGPLNLILAFMFSDCDVTQPPVQIQMHDNRWDLTFCH